MVFKGTNEQRIAQTGANDKSHTGKFWNFYDLPSNLQDRNGNRWTDFVLTAGARAS